MKKLIFLLPIFVLLQLCLYAQVGIGTATPAASAKLDVSSTTQGFLPPRMTTTQRDAIVSPATGLVIFNTTTNSLETKNSSGWVSLSSSFVALPTIVIGTQQWMSKNLDVAFYRNGDVIPQVTDQTAWAGLATGAWCYFNNDSTQGTKFGKLYNWYAVNDPRGLAPQGWHIPSSTETLTLIYTLGGNSVAGAKMKEAGTVTWTTSTAGGNNNSGWAGLSGGSRYLDGSFWMNFFGKYCFWWNSDAWDISTAWSLTLSYDATRADRGYDNKISGSYVRCVRD